MQPRPRRIEPSPPASAAQRELISGRASRIVSTAASRKKGNTSAKRAMAEPTGPMKPKSASNMGFLQKLAGWTVFRHPDALCQPHAGSFARQHGSGEINESAMVSSAR